MRKYIWAFLITIPIMLLAWNIVDSAEEVKLTYNDTAEKSEINQIGIWQGTDEIMPEERETGRKGILMTNCLESMKQNKSVIKIADNFS